MGKAELHSQNWQAFLRLELRSGEDKTYLVPIERYGPLTVQRPFYPEQDCCHVYLLHPPGGVVGGDKIELRVDCKSQSSVLFTTPGAGKFYLSAAHTAYLTQHFEVADRASLEYLPQENIYFPGAQVRSRTSINVEQTGQVMLWEKHCFGRPANNEEFASGQLHSQLELRSDNQLLFSETQRIDISELQRSSGLRNHPVIGTFVIFGIELDQDRLRTLQTICPEGGLGGITQPYPGLLIARFMGESTSAIDAYFIGLWEILRPALLRREASHPRIWNT